MAWYQSGTSSNITFYVDRRAQPHNLWAEVLTDGLEKRNGRWVARLIPTYHFRVYRNKVGELGTFKYRPRSRLDERLAPALVSRLIREKGYK